MTALRRLILLLAAAGLAGAWARRRAEPPLPALPPGPPGPVDAEVVEDPEPPPAPAPESPPATGRPPVPDPQPRLKPLNPEASVASVEYPTMEMDALSLPMEEGEPRVTAMPPAVGDPIDLAPEGDVIVIAVTDTNGAAGVADAVDMALDDYAAPPDVEDYAYAAGLVESPDLPLEDEYALVESAEPDAWQADPGSEVPPEAEEPVTQESPAAAAGPPPLDIVTVVDDLLDDPS